MILLVFLNEHDKNSYLMGRSLPDYLKGDYVKIYTRYDDKTYDKCEVKDTLSTIREYVQVWDKVIVSFGLRLFPPDAYKKAVDTYKHTQKSLVLLKKLKGSKTWTISKGELSFDNCRVSDTGLFVLLGKDLKESRSTNFNSFLRELISQKKLDYKFVDYWVFTSPRKYKQHKKRQR